MTTEEIAKARTWLDEKCQHAMVTEQDDLAERIDDCDEEVVAAYAAHVTAEKDKEIEMMNGMNVEPLGLDDRLPCAVYLPPSLCLGLGTTVRTLLTALAQRRRWVEEGKLRGDLILVPSDPTETLAKIRGELAKKDAEIERLRGRLSNLVEAVDDLIAESEGVYGLRLNGDPSLWEELIEVGWLLALEEAKAALEEEKE